MQDGNTFRVVSINLNLIAKGSGVRLKIYVVRSSVAYSTYLVDGAVMQLTIMIT